MKKNTKLWTMTFSILSAFWLFFISLNILFAGKSILSSIYGSLPDFILLLVPMLFLFIQINNKKKNLYTICTLIIALLLGITQVDINLLKLDKKNPDTDNSFKVKVFNWNTKCWDLDKDKNRFYEFLKEQNADIYLLQEYMYYLPDWQTRKDMAIDPAKIVKNCSFIPGFSKKFMLINDELRIKEEFPGYYYSPNFQFVIISRYPIIQSYLDSSEQFAVSDININGIAVRFFNVHMVLHLKPSNPLAIEFYHDMHRRFLARRIGFTNLLNNINNTVSDYLIAGDFNTTKHMGSLNSLYRNHFDAIKFSNDLYSNTFKYHGLRFWRLDYIFVPKHTKQINVKSMQILDDQKLSDHKPMSLYFEFISTK